MKQILTTLALVIATSMVGQNYSTFYGTYDVNANINVNKNVNVTGTVNQNINKTVTTIDYGALAAANAQKEANRLNSMMFADEREARIAEAIAVDPFAAFTYANKRTIKSNRRDSKKMNRGFTDRSYWEFRIPHPLLFSGTSQFGIYRNTSESGVLTEIGLSDVYNRQELIRLSHGKELSDSLYDPEFLLKNHLLHYPVGQISPYFKRVNKENIFTHKTELQRANVYGYPGYKATVIVEDDYIYAIIVQYISRNHLDKINYNCTVRYSISKTDGTFEDLEGRRHYFNRLCEEIIATAQFRYY